MRRATWSPVLSDSKAEGAASFLPQEVEQAEAPNHSHQPIQVERGGSPEVGWTTEAHAGDPSEEGDLGGENNTIRI